jgi:hypothetical protein
MADIKPMFFDNYIDFVNNDVRKNRQLLQITSESLSKRCDAIMPEFVINKKTVLDLGSALGAMGHYALCNGATYYTGVEIQQEYRTRSITLLTKYHCSGWKILSDINQVDEKYDTVIACGFVHGFFDVFNILKIICNLSNKYVIIETYDPRLTVFNTYSTDKKWNRQSSIPTITFDNSSMVTHTAIFNEYGSHKGISSLPNKEAIDMIMSVYGFTEDSRIYPESIIDSHDGYSPMDSSKFRRFISRYIKSTPIPTLESIIKNDNLDV